jgi:hypothetical protein
MFCFDSLLQKTDSKKTYLQEWHETCLLTKAAARHFVWYKLVSFWNPWYISRKQEIGWWKEGSLFIVYPLPTSLTSFLSLFPCIIGKHRTNTNIHFFNHQTVGFSKSNVILQALPVLTPTIKIQIQITI